MALTKQQQRLVLEYQDAVQQVVDAEARRAQTWSQLVEAVTPDQMLVVERVLSLYRRGVRAKSA